MNVLISVGSALWRPRLRVAADAVLGSISDSGGVRPEPAGRSGSLARRRGAEGLRGPSDRTPASRLLATDGHSGAAYAMKIPPLASNEAPLM
jgi:hypothetical protein